MVVKNKEKKKRIAHILAGMVILIHAYEKHESGHGPYLFFAIAGIVFLSVALFHHKLEKKFPWIDGVFFIIEGILSLIVAYNYVHMGKKLLPFTYALAGSFQIVVAFIKARQGVKKKHTIDSTT